MKITKKLTSLFNFNDGEVDKRIKKVKKYSNKELRMRRGLINGAIRLCMSENDPYNQIENYKKDLRLIDNEIKSRKNPKNNPVEIEANLLKFKLKSEV
jgi:hypothetical protein